MAELTLHNLIRHVDLYGPEGAMEAARDHFAFEELVELQKVVDTRTRGPKPRKSPGDRVRELLGLDTKEAA